MPTEIQVPTGLTTEGLLGRRYLARFIDTIILLVLLSLLILAWSVVVTGGNTGRVRNPVFSFLLLFGWIGYGTILESSKRQATFGKRFVGLRVYNAQGGRPAWMQAVKRNLAKDGPFLVLGFLPGAQILALAWLAAHLIVMHRSPVYQAIHDRAAHTCVAAPEETTQLRIA